MSKGISNGNVWSFHPLDVHGHTVLVYGIAERVLQLALTPVLMSSSVLQRAIRPTSAQPNQKNPSSIQYLCMTLESLEHVLYLCAAYCYLMERISALHTRGCKANKGSDQVNRNEVRWKGTMYLFYPVYLVPDTILHFLARNTNVECWTCGEMNALENKPHETGTDLMLKHRLLNTGTRLWYDSWLFGKTKVVELRHLSDLGQRLH